MWRSVRMIAEAAASVPLCLYDGPHEIEEHPLLRLIERPTPTSTRAEFFETLIGFLLVSGNAYVEVIAAGDQLRELHVLRPDRVSIVPGEDGWPEAYEYTLDGSSPFRLDGDAIPGVRRVLHQKLFHPLNDHYGLSPIESAAAAVDIHNAASRWNKALLDNSARPSGALVYTSRDGNLTTEQYDRLKSELETGFQGAGNAGRPLLLEGGLDWKSMSMSPKDLDFMEAKHGAAREIALALGVPPMLLGIPGDNTFSNYQEANRTFWRQTVLPLVQRIISACDEWLTPGYSGALSLKPNIDDIPALSVEQDTLWARLEKTSFLTDDEKRAAIGYGPLPPQQKFNPGQIRKPSGKPGGGQWTKPGGDGGGGGNPSNGDGTDGIGDPSSDGAPTDPFGDGLGNIDPEAIQIPDLPIGGTDEIVDPPESDIKDPEAEVVPVAKRPATPSTPSPQSPSPGIGHNNPPGPIAPETSVPSVSPTPRVEPNLGTPAPSIGPIQPLPIEPLPGRSGNVFNDEDGARAPRGFDNQAQLNEFKQDLSDVLPADVEAVMQGSAIENGGKDFRTNPTLQQPASDFDVALVGQDLYDQAANVFPGFAGRGRVGPLKEADLAELGINTGRLSDRYYRKTEFMIYPNGIELYKRGPGYPLVTRR